LTTVDASTCDLSDAYGDRARIVPPVLRHFGGRQHFSGLVETVKCFEDNSRVKELLNTPGNGRVLVVDGGGSLRYALLGDTIGQEAVDHGWAGVVVHGCIRDSAVLGSLDLGVLALGATPRRSLKNGEGLTSLPIEIAGVAVTPGDFLAADEDGVVLLDAAPGD
jgi:regulator of ribonuclease activity A